MVRMAGIELDGTDAGVVQYMAANYGQKVNPGDRNVHGQQGGEAYLGKPTMPEMAPVGFPMNDIQGYILH